MYIDDLLDQLSLASSQENFSVKVLFWKNFLFLLSVYNVVDDFHTAWKNYIYEFSFQFT